MNDKHEVNDMSNQDEQGRVKGIVGKLCDHTRTLAVECYSAQLDLPKDHSAHATIEALSDALVKATRALRDIK